MIGSCMSTTLKILRNSTILWSATERFVAFALTYACGITISKAGLYCTPQTRILSFVGIHRRHGADVVHDVPEEAKVDKMKRLGPYTEPSTQPNSGGRP